MNKNEQDDEIIEVTGQKLTASEKFYYDLAYKEPVDSITHIEATAKVLIGVITASCGVLMTALKIIVSVEETGVGTTIGYSWAVVACWGLSLVFLLNVITPLPYRTRRGDPTDLQATYKTIRLHKAIFLWIGLTMFLVGMLTGLFTFTL